MLRAVGLAALALATVALALFVLVELRAAPSSAGSSPPASSSAGSAPAGPSAPAGASPPAGPSAPAGAPTHVTATAPAAPPGETVDPLDRVVDGKSRRQWHAIYADRQRRIESEIARNQELAERAGADPRAVADAEARVRELRAEMKRDLEALSQIDHAP